MKTSLTPEQGISLKKTYLNILAFFLEKEKIESRYLRCLLKWGFQLQIGPEDLAKTTDLSRIAFTKPEEKIDRLESIYHLVCMIYLDQVVEDVELEVATLYAGRLGFTPSVVSELFTSIATRDSDKELKRPVREEVLEFLKLYDV